MRFTERLLALPLLLVLVALLVFPAAAADIAGKIRGSVTDTSGAAVIGAAVVARNVETGVETRVVSTEDGSYSFESLLPAAYTITCELSGFKKFVTTDTRATAQQSTTLHIALTVGAVSESVELSGSGERPVTPL
jgi:polyisoprenoid-binding protein YceI